MDYIERIRPGDRRQGGHGAAKHRTVIGQHWAAGIACDQVAGMPQAGQASLLS